MLRCRLVSVVLILLSASLDARSASVELRLILSGLSSPVFVTHAQDGSRRLFILEQPGRILVLQPGSSTPAVFLDIRNRVASGDEKGLLGLVFHPQFFNNRRFFVNYTRQPDGATVVSEFHSSAADPNLADSGSEVVMLRIAQPYANHNGGMIAFGPDGYLYIGMGDGGSANDPENRAQNVDELLGKILRIDIDTPGSDTVRYSSPSSNPFSGATPGRDEIYALGFRNPWRFSFDRSTGNLYVGDVGQDAIEEVDIVDRGGNYGWRVFEGSQCTGLGPASCSETNFIPPIAEYSHNGGRCAIIGGYVYRGPGGVLPAGVYVYGDLCTGEIFTLSNGTQAVLLKTPYSISSFGEDESGEIYLVAYDGAIFRIVRKTRGQITSN